MSGEARGRARAEREDTNSRAGCNAQEQLFQFIARFKRMCVLSGAGCSTESGIPAYRDENGIWTHAPPVQYRDFLRSAEVRRRYWARSQIGWARVAKARPNRAHDALAALERRGLITAVITQNVDGLHQRAGSRRVIDLHGRLDRVVCLDCGTEAAREQIQRLLEGLNPGWTDGDGTPARPDGDAALEPPPNYRIPACRRCAGVLKPTVVFFGEAVPRERSRAALAVLEESDALLVVGSSLTVWSGYRFVRAARGLGVPVAALNRGCTRADDEVDLKVELGCGDALGDIAKRLSVEPPSLA